MHAIVESRPGSSALSLVTANLITIVLALYEGWNLHELMIIYWAQSVIIGYFSILRMLDLKQFSTENFTMNGVRPPETAKTKRSTATFFALHYGGFHAGYLAFLVAGEQYFQGSWLVLFICAAVFYLNHRYSYFHNKELDENRKPNIGIIMFFPYARIVPMHLTIVIGGAIGPTTTSSLLLFLGMKTVADVIMHKIEHARWRK
jgi:hypothetical protein